jgi:hypothetical protein
MRDDVTFIAVFEMIDFDVDHYCKKNKTQNTNDRQTRDKLPMKIHNLLYI